MRELRSDEVAEVSGGIYENRHVDQFRDMAVGAAAGAIMGGPVGFCVGLVAGSITGYVRRSQA